MFGVVGLISAQNISFSYPDSVNASDVFEVNLSLLDFSYDIYDIKIDIINSSGDRIAEIYNGTGWTSTNYYVNNIINNSELNSSLFFLNITELYNGSANLTVRIRDSSGIPIFSENYSMDVLIYNDIINTTNTTNNTETTTTSPETEISLKWDDDEIINGDEIKITVKVVDMEVNLYDVKIWIVDDDDNIISERYGSYGGDSEWKSGNYYVEEFFEGPGNDSSIMKIRIKDDYKDFVGSATIKARIRKISESYLDSFEKTIDILEQEGEDEDDEDDNNEVISISSNSSSSGNVITLGVNAESSLDDSEESDENGEVIYKSKNEHIKEYSMYGFGLLCVGLIIVLLIDK